MIFNELECLLILNRLARISRVVFVPSASRLLSKEALLTQLVWECAVAHGAFVPAATGLAVSSLASGHALLLTNAPHHVIASQVFHLNRLQTCHTQSTNMVRYTNLKWSHGHAKVLQHLVHLTWTGSFLQQEHRLVRIGTQHAIANEAKAIASQHCGLADALAQRHGSPNGIERRISTLDYFQELHHIRRREEICECGILTNKYNWQLQNNCLRVPTTWPGLDVALPIASMSR